MKYPPDKKGAHGWYGINPGDIFGKVYKPLIEIDEWRSILLGYVPTGGADVQGQHEDAQLLREPDEQKSECSD